MIWRDATRRVPTAGAYRGPRGPRVDAAQPAPYADVMFLCEIAGTSIRGTYHALQRAAERAGLQGQDDLLADLRDGHHLLAAQNGLDAVRGRSDLVYLIRCEGLLGCVPVSATVVTAVEWTRHSAAIRAAVAGRPSRGWRRVPARVWPADTRATELATATAAVVARGALHPLRRPG